MTSNRERDSIATADLVARRSYGKLIAFLSARTHDVASAEDALAEAFTTALVDWPAHGCPTNPEAWLLTVARRRIIDAQRRQATAESASETLRVLTDQSIDAAETEIPDRRLALLFVCAHPAIDPTIRAPLMLQGVLGLDAKAIASAFLVAPATMGKRLVRAKTKIRENAIPFVIPDREELPVRLNSVLDAIYAAFTEGWTDPGGTDLVRRDLTHEALFLVRLVIELLPNEPEAMGLLALMLHAEARRDARRKSTEEFVPFSEQNQELWNWDMIKEAEALLLQASALGTIGRYQLEAALQSAHVYRVRTGRSNWEDVVQLYDVLFKLAPSPVIEINRAAAIAELKGAQTALEVLGEIAADPRVAEYQPYWATRADLLARLGAKEEASQAYQLAIGLERDPAVRRFLQKRNSQLTKLTSA
ncbi:MAG TPA: DUF6596 domain-containing protein [Pyrinomonadaceae bacterium]|nr:DUF6596 domain-containing protein [Pyrinomonadaceae bacterium]